MNKEKMLNDIENEAFRVNCGIIARTFTIMEHKYHKLREIQNVVEENGISESEFVEIINFLYEEKYLLLRTVLGKEESSLADHNYDVLEAKLSGKGLRLMRGEIKDTLIKV